jgi:hypothetical protein
VKNSSCKIADSTICVEADKIPGSFGTKKKQKTKNNSINTHLHRPSWPSFSGEVSSSGYSSTHTNQNRGLCRPARTRTTTITTVVVTGRGPSKMSAPLSDGDRATRRSGEEFTLPLGRERPTQRQRHHVIHHASRAIGRARIAQQKVQTKKKNSTKAIVKASETRKNRTGLLAVK